jgi:septal ring factor EnvC (AmiA/AmiB activator)
VTKGLPDPFIDSLTHESIIVQIPLLHGQVNNRLYKVLSVFDQSRQDSQSKQVLNIDETEYAGDAEMQLIVNRLLAAASDARMRHDMNVEDEYFSVIEKRDTTIMIKDRRIAEQEVKISEQEEHIAVQEEHIAAQDKQLAAQEEHIAVQEEHIAAQDKQLAAQDKQIASQQELIRLSVKMLIDAGMSPEAVAVNLNIDVDRVRQLAGQ